MGGVTGAGRLIAPLSMGWLGRLLCSGSIPHKILVPRGIEHIDEDPWLSGAEFQQRGGDGAQDPALVWAAGGTTDV